MNCDRLPLVATIIAGLALIAVVVNAALVVQNQKMEAELQQRQQFINQTLQLNQVANALVQALGNAAVSGNDAAIRDLLSESGITINAPAAAPPAK